MRGTLHKTEQGWTVRYLDYKKAHDIMYCGESLPLHPDDVGRFLPDDEEFAKNNPDVEFEIVEGCCTSEGQIKRYVDCKGCDKKQNYAKLISSKEQQLVQIDQDNPITRGSTALVYKQEVDVADRLAKETLYTEEDVIRTAIHCWNIASKPEYGKIYNVNEIVKNYIQSLKQPK